MKIYDHYWQMQQAKQSGIPQFPVCYDSQVGAKSELDVLIADRVTNAQSVLDFGAGDFRMRLRLDAWQVKARYTSLDIGKDHQYDYCNIDDVNETFDAVFCMDVLEHMSLEQGVSLLEKLKARLSTNGTLILQTPNGRTIRNPLGWDITHQQLYNAPDLWALLRAVGYRAEGYRVVNHAEKNLRYSLSFLISRVVTSRILGCDYADNLCFFCSPE